MKTIDLAYDYSAKPIAVSSKKKWYPTVSVHSKTDEHMEVGDKVVLIGKVISETETESGCTYSIEVQKFCCEAEDLGSSLDKILTKKNKEKNEQDEYKMRHPNQCDDFPELVTPNLGQCCPPVVKRDCNDVPEVPEITDLNAFIEPDTTAFPPYRLIAAILDHNNLPILDSTLSPILGPTL